MFVQRTFLVSCVARVCIRHKLIYLRATFKRIRTINLAEVRVESSVNGAYRGLDRLCELNFDSNCVKNILALLPEKSLEIEKRFLSQRSEWKQHIYICKKMLGFGVKLFSLSH